MHVSFHLLCYCLKFNSKGGNTTFSLGIANKCIEEILFGKGVHNVFVILDDSLKAF